MKKLISVLAVTLTVSLAAAAGAQMMMDGGMMHHGQDGEAAGQARQQMMEMRAAKGKNSVTNCDCMGMKKMPGGAGGMSAMAGTGKMSMMGGHGMMPMMKGMGKGAMMMGGCNMGMGSMMGMMGMNPALDSKDRAAFRKFMEETREIRKELHELRFNYMEARWNPDSTIGELQEMADKMDRLQAELTEKMPK